MNTTITRQPKDGDRIDLPMGWYMKLDGSTREEGDLQGFVFSPDGKESCSLNAAREYGRTTGDNERELPKAVHDAVCSTDFDRFE